MTALETLKCYTHGKKNTDKVEISVWALNRIINALTQECVDPTQKHIGNALDMRCDDAEQIDYHDDFETASRKIHDYEERQKQNNKKCCSDCQLIGTDSCYMVCGGSKSLYKPKQKQEPQCTEHPCLGTLCRYYKQPCEDAISRQAVDELSKELVHITRDKADFLCNFWEGLQQLPPVTPKSGKWIERKNVAYLKGVRWKYECSECGYEVRQKYHYCPNCGARMVEPQESEDRNERKII